MGMIVMSLILRVIAIMMLEANNVFFTDVLVLCDLWVIRKSYIMVPTCGPSAHAHLTARSLRRWMRPRSRKSQKVFRCDASAMREAKITD